MKYGSLYDIVVRMYGKTCRTLFREKAFLPIQTFIEITAACNLRCSFCLVGSRFDSEFARAQRARELSTDEWRKVIDQTTRFGLITFTGGEPFVRSDMFELLEYTAARRRCHVITNGSLIDEDAAARLVGLGPRRPFGPGLMFIGISLHGSRSLHDAITGRAGTFDNSVSAIRFIQDKKRETGSRWPQFHITSVISRSTIEELPGMVSLAAELGVSDCNFVLENRAFDALADHDTEMSDFYRTPPDVEPIEEDLLRDVYRRAEQIARDRNVHIRWPRMPFDDMAHFYQNRHTGQGFACYTPWTKLYITHYGAVHACCFLTMGDVREQSIRQIWNNGSFRAFRREMIRRGTFPICEGCCELFKKSARPAIRSG